MVTLQSRAMKMVSRLSAHYGTEADTRELAFLRGGIIPPGYCEVTLVGTVLGLPFSTETGEPMGRLTGSL